MAALRVLGPTARVMDLDGLRHAHVAATRTWSEIARGEAAGEPK
jgi:hypothetical protein